MSVGLILRGTNGIIEPCLTLVGAAYLLGQVGLELAFDRTLAGADFHRTFYCSLLADLLSSRGVFRVWLPIALTALAVLSQTCRCVRQYHVEVVASAGKSGKSFGSALRTAVTGLWDDSRGVVSSSQAGLRHNAATIGLFVMCLPFFYSAVRQTQGVCAGSGNDEAVRALNAMFVGVHLVLMVLLVGVLALQIRVVRIVAGAGKDGAPAGEKKTS